jgi:hypothetical protein
VGEAPYDGVRAIWDRVEETLVRTCWRWNLDKSTHKLIPWGESEEEPGGEELNVCAGHEGEPAGEITRETTSTGELAEEKPGELAGAMDNACKYGESELAHEEWSC